MDHQTQAQAERGRASSRRNGITSHLRVFCLQRLIRVSNYQQKSSQKKKINIGS